MEKYLALKNICVQKKPKDGVNPQFASIYKINIHLWGHKVQWFPLEMELQNEVMLSMCLP